MADLPLQAAADLPLKSVRFSDIIELLPPDLDETDQDEEQRWFSQADIASFREDAIRTVQAVRAVDDPSDLDDEVYCLRGLEKKMLKRPPPNFVKRVLALQTKQRRAGIWDPSTSLQLFSIACSKWARKRAAQLAAEDEYDAYQIFMAGLRKQSSNVDNDHDFDEEDDEEDYYEDEEFDFCTEGEFVHDVYDYKHDHTEDETEYDDSDAYDNLLVSVVDDEEDANMAIIAPALR